MTIATERIVCAALRHADGRVICGVRHFDELMMGQITESGGDWRGAAQGFVTSRYTFVDRLRGWAIAESTGQIIRDPDWQRGVLHSEHLY